LERLSITRQRVGGIPLNSWGSPLLTYTILYSATLAEDTWTVLQDDIVDVGSEVTVSDALAASGRY